MLHRATSPFHLIKQRESLDQVIFIHLTSSPAPQHQPCLMPSSHISSAIRSCHAILPFMRLDAFPAHVVTPVGKRDDSKLCKLQEQEMPPHGEAPYRSSSEAASAHIQPSGSARRSDYIVRQVERADLSIPNGRYFHIAKLPSTPLPPNFLLL